MPGKRGDGRTVTTLRLQADARRIGCGVQSLIRGSVIGRRCDADRYRDSGRRSVVRTRKEMPAHACAESLSNLPSRRRRCAKKCDELIPTGMGDQFSFAQVRACELEDRAQNHIGIWLTKLLGDPSIVIDVGDEQSNWTTRCARLGNRCRGSIDEGVERSEPSLLIEKNEMLLQAGRSQPRPQWLRVGGKDNRKSEGANDAREKEVIYVI